EVDPYALSGDSPRLFTSGNTEAINACFIRVGRSNTVRRSFTWRAVMAKRLSNKVALVTGGSRGIGAAIARQLADDGADVVISYVSSADKANALVRQLQDKGVRTAAFQADQASPVEVQGLVKQTLEAFGRLDILVNSAGVFVTGVPGDAANDEAALARQYAVNVGGVVAAVHAAAPHLPAGGRIINIGSTLGVRTPFAGLADYS